MVALNWVPTYTVKIGDEYLKCFSFTNHNAFGNHGATTMGMQMINDPTLELVGDGDDELEPMKGEELEEARKKVNAKILTDGFVCATKDIEQGEEIFIEYKWTDNDSGEDAGSSESGGGSKDSEEGSKGSGEGSKVNEVPCMAHDV